MISNKLRVFNDINVPETQGTYLVGRINLNYSEIVNLIGYPTHQSPSGDNKVQKEWVVEFDNQIFTIYDWKTYDVNYTVNQLDTFHIGGTSDSTELIEYLLNFKTK